MDISINDAIGTSHTDQTYCGARSFVLSPSPAIVSISGNTLTLNPLLPADAGSWDVTLAVGLAAYPTIATISIQFKIAVVCTVTGLNFATSPSNLTQLKVGIDTQPLLIPYAVSKTPNCPQIVTFALSGTIPTFVSLQNPQNASGDIQVDGALRTNHGSSTMTLTASVDGQTTNASFTVQIIDPCSAAVFETAPSPITDMSLTLYPFRSTSKTQTFRIYTDVERAHPSIICPYTATLLPSKPFVLLNPTFTQLIVDGQYATLTDAGPYAMTLRVTSPTFLAI
jgi:hypothetical protein